MNIWKKDFHDIDWTSVELLDWIESIGEILSWEQRDFIRKVGPIIQEFFKDYNPKYAAPEQWLPSASDQEDSSDY